MVKDYNMWDCKPSSLPADPNARLSVCSKPKSEEEKEGKYELEEEHTEEEEKEMEKIPYREAVGSLIYLATTSHPGIYHLPLVKSPDIAPSIQEHTGTR